MTIHTQEDIEKCLANNAIQEEGQVFNAWMVLLAVVPCFEMLFEFKFQSTFFSPLEGLVKHRNLQRGRKLGQRKIMIRTFTKDKKEISSTS